MLEFVVMGIPFLYIIVSLWWMCMGMFQYHTVAEAVQYTAREASVHGAGCVGKTCATTVESTAQLLAARAIGIPDSALDVTFTSSASTVTCNPLSTCYSNSAKWPSLAGNTALTTEITVAATFQFTPAISLWVPGGGKVTFPAVTLGANSEQPIFY